MIILHFPNADVGILIEIKRCNVDHCLRHFNIGGKLIEPKVIKGVEYKGGRMVETLNGGEEETQNQEHFDLVNEACLTWVLVNLSHQKNIFGEILSTFDWP